MSRLVVALAGLTFAVLLAAPFAHAGPRGGDLLWHVDFDLAGGTDRPSALAAGRGRVVFVGVATNTAGNSELVVRAHDAQTGALLWADQLERAGGVASVVMDDQRVIVAGTGVDEMGQTQDLIRAYVANTGDQAWTKVGPGLAGRLFMDGPRVIVAGGAHVRAYVAKTGVLVWEWTNAAPLPPGYSGEPSVVAISGDTLYAAGSVSRSAPNAIECLVRAHDLVSGALLWQTIHNLSGSGFCIPATIGADGRRVVIGGWGGIAVDDYFVLAFDADTGEFVWQDHQRVPANRVDVAVAVDIARRRTFVAGWISVPTPGALGGVLEAYVVRSYDTKTGTLLWKDELTGPVPIEWQAFDVEAASGRVFAVGQNMTSGLWLVRAYDPSDGDVRWEDRYLPANPPADVRQANLRQSLAVDGRRVFVAGSEFNAAGDLDIILRAYDAK